MFQLMNEHVPVLISLAAVRNLSCKGTYENYTVLRTDDPPETGGVFPVFSAFTITL